MAIKELANLSLVEQYTYHLLLQFAESGNQSVRLRSSEPLPIPAKAVAGPVDFPHVRNRLKIMCNLDPVRYQTPVDGRIKLFIPGKRYQIHCHFNDSTDDPDVQLIIEEFDAAADLVPHFEHPAKGLKFKIYFVVNCVFGGVALALAIAGFIDSAQFTIHGFGWGFLIASLLLFMSAFLNYAKYRKAKSGDFQPIACGPRF